MPAHGLPEPLIPDFGQSMAAYRQGFGLGNDQRVNALNQQAGAIAATGDMKGASNALLSGGELSTGLGIQDRLQAAEDRKRAQALQDRQLGMQTQKMGWEIEDRKIAKAEKVNGAFARMAMAVKNAPEHQRGALWGQVIEQGRRLGADVTGYEDPSSIDMALAKSSETAEYLAYLKSQKAAAAPNTPSGYRLAADGRNLEFIPGGPADPAVKPKGRDKFTEVQSKAANFGNMMVKAEGELEAAMPKGPNGKPGPVTNPKNIFGAARDGLVPLEGVRNMMRPDQTQAYEQSAQQWIRAKLRKESGAAIGKDEMQQEFLTYFPQYWDGPETIRRKALAREEATKGMKAESGGAYDTLFGAGVQPQQGGSTPPPPPVTMDVTAIKKKYGLD